MSSPPRFPYRKNSPARGESQAIREIIHEEIDANNERQNAHFDEMINANTEKIFSVMDSNTEIILNAVEARVQESEANVNARLEKLETIYRIRSLEDSNQSDMMQMILQLQTRVKKLETRFA